MFSCQTSASKGYGNYKPHANLYQTCRHFPQQTDDFEKLSTFQKDPCYFLATPTNQIKNWLKNFGYDTMWNTKYKAVNSFESEAR